MDIDEVCMCTRVVKRVDWMVLPVLSVECGNKVSSVALGSFALCRNNLVLRGDFQFCWL